MTEGQARHLENMVRLLEEDWERRGSESAWPEQETDGAD